MPHLTANAMSHDDSPHRAPHDAPAVLWQGFHHGWTYNHRLNRIGDWIVQTPSTDGELDARVKHSAASGSGEDEAAWKSFYTVLQSGTVRFHPVDVERIHLGGEEEEDQAFAKEVRVKLPAEMRDREVYAVLL